MATTALDRRAGVGEVKVAEQSRISLNQITTAVLSLKEALDGCARHQIPSIGIWRHKVHEIGLAASARMVRDSGIHVSSLCRGGMFPAPTKAARQERLEDNYRAVDEAAALGADSLVLVLGASDGVTLSDGRQMAEEGIAALVPYARERGVRLGLEPLHPMFAAERSVLVTLDHSLRLAAAYDPDVVGVIVDIFLWWDPQVYFLIAQAGKRIFGFHVSDWLVPLPDTLMGRGMMGDGVIEIKRLRAAVDAAGYDGSIEVEIFNQKLWDSPPDAVLALMVERFLAHV